MPGDLPAVLQQLVDTTKTVLATDGVGLMLTDADGRLGSAVSTDAVAELLEQVQADFGEGPCLTAYSSGEPLAVTDLGADPRWIRLAAVVGQVSVRAVAAVPVRLAGVVVGSLSAYTTTARAWSPEELAGLEAFAELAAGVVQGGVRLDASETEVGQLRQALTSRVLIEQAKGCWWPATAWTPRPPSSGCAARPAAPPGQWPTWPARSSPKPAPATRPPRSGLRQDRPAGWPSWSRSRPGSRPPGPPPPWPGCWWTGGCGPWTPRPA